ncbi:hypothetical protein CDAR_571571 [Caerostris darwini]|uniref:Uncharacterized protein n=1 Tax=Caerostris darwini TaxID=1538125 RepID=A0AAV4WG64_9ARAC|nr:hypothetical protein CDAR_571571 [Caerostris darwini]
MECVGFVSGPDHPKGRINGSFMGRVDGSSRKKGSGPESPCICPTDKPVVSWSRDRQIYWEGGLVSGGTELHKLNYLCPMAFILQTTTLEHTEIGYAHGLPHAHRLYPFVLMAHGLCHVLIVMPTRGHGLGHMFYR